MSFVFLHILSIATSKFSVGTLPLFSMYSVRRSCKAVRTEFPADKIRNRCSSRVKLTKKYYAHIFLKQNKFSFFLPWICQQGSSRNDRFEAFLQQFSVLDIVISHWIHDQWSIKFVKSCCKFTRPLKTEKVTLLQCFVFCLPKIAKDSLVSYLDWLPFGWVPFATSEMVFTAPQT